MTASGLPARPGRSIEALEEMTLASVVVSVSSYAEALATANARVIIKPRVTLYFTTFLSFLRAKPSRSVVPGG
jgi:hypothetical protein